MRWWRQEHWASLRGDLRQRRDILDGEVDDTCRQRLLERWELLRHERGEGYTHVA